MRLNDLVSGWMSDRPVTIAPDRPLIEAFELMTEHGVRHLPVVDERGQLAGVVSDRDLYRLAASGDPHDPASAHELFARPVSEIMTREPVLSVDPLATLAEAARLLVAAKVSSLPVIDGGRLVGFLTTHDLLRALGAGTGGATRAEKNAMGVS